MTAPKRERHLNYFKIQLTAFAAETSELLAQEPIDLERIRNQSVFIRGAAMRLRFPHVVAIGKLTSQLCEKIASSPCETQAKRLLVSMDDALNTILKALEAPSKEPPVELLMLRHRLESHLNSLQSN